MLFNSFTFVAFCLAVFVLYYLPAARRVQTAVLILASFVFYGWHTPKLLLLLLFSVLLNAVVSWRVWRTTGATQKRWAAAGVAANLGLLAIFKYASLLTQLGAVLSRSHVDPAFLLLHVPLPIGISFYTFEGISLLVDVFEGRALTGDGARRFRDHLSRTALFIAFFPHLVAGPILKARNFYPQIEPKSFRRIDWYQVFRCLVIGYFLKVVVADNLKDFTYWIEYPYFQQQSSVTLLFLLFGFSIQIFADFAGYSLIAIGVAALFGYDLPENFNFPYVSRSLGEFWRRWHISLSTWLRDYLYIPLGGNRRGTARTYCNLFVVMLLGGLWHGAALSFLVWGAYHGAGLAAEKRIADLRGRDVSKPDTIALPTWRHIFADAARAALVFIFVSFGWLLFKLQNFSQALVFLGCLKSNVHAQSNPMLVLPIVIYALPVLAYHARRFPGLSEKLAPLSARRDVRPAFLSIAYAVMIALITLNHGASNAFIYFQF